MLFKRATPAVPKAESETEEVPGDNRAGSVTIGPHKGFAGVVACFGAMEVEVESGGNHCSIYLK